MRHLQELERLWVVLPLIVRKYDIMIYSGVR